MKVLIIDDNQGTSFTLAQLFKTKGHEADFITDAKKALEFVKAGKASQYDHVILDIYLNGVNGIDIYNALAEKSQQSKALIITGCDERTDIFRRALNLNIPLIMKTFKPREFLENLELGTIADWANAGLRERGVTRVF